MRSPIPRTVMAKTSPTQTLGSDLRFGYKYFKSINHPLSDILDHISKASNILYQTRQKNAKRLENYFSYFETNLLEGDPDNPTRKRNQTNTPQTQQWTNKPNKNKNKRITQFIRQSQTNNNTTPKYNMTPTVK